MRDVDAEIVQRALDEGLIRPADRARIEKLTADTEKRGGRLYAAQALVRERLISCADLLRLQDGTRARPYECPHCHHRHAREDLPRKKGQRFACKGCKKPVELERAELSRIEVLTSRDPLDLSVPLSASQSESSSASNLSELDLDRYDVQEELGRGGYGVVFKAVQRDLEREVALKVLRAGPDLPPVNLERFVREGRAVSRLKHPNIVTVYDIGRQRDLFAMAMEYVPGKPLRDVVRDRGALPWREAGALLLEVLRGVEHAHEAGIIHRDLKTNNILVEADSGRPRIIDFGLAKELDGDSALTQGGAIIGTPNYLSPEQIEGRSNQADARVDVWALGVIFYELLCGKRPFEAKQKAEVYKKIMTEEPRSVVDMTIDSSGKSPVPEAVAEVVHRALEKKAAGRFQTAREMREALEAALAAADEGGGAKRRSGTHRRPSKAGVPAVRSTGKVARPAAAGGGGPSPALIAGGVVAVLVLGIGVGVVTKKGGPPPVADARTTTPRPPVVTERSTPPRPTERPVERPAQRPTEAAPAAVTEPEPEPASEAPPPPPTEAPPPATEAAPPATEPAPPPATEAAPPPATEAPPAPPADAPAPVALDEGKGDAATYPDLAEKSNDGWVKRAFLINALAEGEPREYAVRGLRLALSDRRELNRAFALRGLLRADVDLLRAIGSKGLFDALVDTLESREEYVARSAATLLARLARDAEKRSEAGWKRWWTETGEALFVEAARQGPPPPPPPRAGGGAPAGAASGEELTTRTREATTHFSRLRDKGLDLVFLIDITKSMDDELARVKSQIEEITSFMDLLLEGKARLGFLTYGDLVKDRLPLTPRLEQVVVALKEVDIWDDPKDKTVPEGVEVVLEEALGEGMGWRRRAHRTVLFLADAEALDKDKAKALAARAREQGFAIHALVAKTPYAKWPPEAFFEELTRLGGGTSIELQTPEELITRLLVLGFGPNAESDLRRFVAAFREVNAKG